MSTSQTEQIGLTLDRMVVFHLEDARYALPLERVQEIQQVVAFSEVPGGGLGVLGLVNLRGEVIPAVDLRQVLGLSGVELSLETPMVIARLDGDRLVALVVDEVEDVMQMPDGCVQPAPAMHDLSANLLGVCHLTDGLVFLLDVTTLFDDVDLPAGR